MPRSTRRGAPGSRGPRPPGSRGRSSRCSATWMGTSSSVSPPATIPRPTASRCCRCRRSRRPSPPARSATPSPASPGAVLLWCSVGTPGQDALRGAEASGARIILGEVPGSLKTEAIVLRSIRYAEADRVLHLYSKTHGRLNAIAKGARRPRSRFGGRLEPFFRLDLVLHQGRGELATVTGAHTVAAHAYLRESGPALGAAARACDSVLRLLDSNEPNPAAYNLLCRYLALLDGD